MRRLSFASVLFIFMAVLAAGCLKDKGFDNGQYGINVSDGNAVAFPNSSQSPVSYGLNIFSGTELVNDVLAVTLESTAPAATDITISLSNTTGDYSAGDVKDYINSVGGAVAVFPVGHYFFPATVVIPAGQKSVIIPFTFFNTAALSPDSAYGVSITIQSASGGHPVASNMKKMMILFSTKNRLDGVYEITGAALRAGDPAATGSFGPYQRELVTSGPNGVQWKGQVLWANGSSTALPAGFEPLITVDPSTNQVTNISSSTGGIFMTSPIIRPDIVGSSQRYDPVKKSLYFEFSWGAGPASRLMSIKAKFIKPR